MTLRSRRDFLRLAGATAGLVAASVAVSHSSQQRHIENEELGMLYDATRCVGCKACMSACKRVNSDYGSLSYERAKFDSDGLWDAPSDLSGSTRTLIKLFKEENLATLNMERLIYLRTLMEETRDFVQKVYYPDLLAIAGSYQEWFNYGAGVTNYMAVPEFPEDTRNSKFSLSGGLITAANLAGIRVVQDHRDEYLIKNIKENVSHAWYEGSATLHPWDGETKPEYTDFKENGKYSWCKAPTLEGKPVQVGPPAQILAAYLAGNPKMKRLVDGAVSTLGISLSDMHSTMGRLYCRGARPI